ncbi:MAG: hypothetical protein H3Z53_10215 [archaeon]|nr:hypothetical protein [archaeon]MCP8314723.1 hypothetical protein [archaeon]
MQFESKQIEIAKRLALGATIYQNAFLNGMDFREQFRDDYIALACFLKNYAYERQGAASAYPDIAVRTIEKIFGGKLQSVTIADSKEAWKIYQEIAGKEFNNIKVNPSHNPMNTDRGVLSLLASQQISNISNHVKTLIEQGKTREAHSFVSSIRGIGTKIASFYMRDIAFLGNLNENEIKNQFYLQPIDTWLEQTISIIFGDAATKRLDDKQRLIVELCGQANCSPIAFNQGAWIIASQIAGNFDTFRKIAEGQDTRSIVNDHILEWKTYIFEVEKFLEQVS